MRVLLALLSSGTLVSTGAPSTGTFPLQDEATGRVRSCEVYSGYVDHCEAPYTGKVVLQREGSSKYVLCTVSVGWVVTCEATGYTGRANLLLRQD